MSVSTTTYTVVNGVILFQEKDGVVHDFVPDPQGSVIMVMDADDNIVYEAEYDPYGNVQSETGTNPSEFGYCGTLGYVKDSPSSMYVRARYLLSNLGRWLTKDPLWPSEPGFVYANAAPNMWVDPSGKIPSIGHLMPPPSSCAVYVCERGPGTFVVKPGHKFTCASISGPHWRSRSCAGGLYAKNSDWRAFNDASEVGDGGLSCPPSSDLGYTCKKVVSGYNSKDVCRFAEETCNCIERARANPGRYHLIGRNCVNFSRWVLECACKEGGPFPGLLGTLCTAILDSEGYKPL